MTVDSVYRVTMKLVIRLKMLSDFGPYTCIANNTFGESKRIVYLHGKLIVNNNLLINFFSSLETILY